MIYHYLQKVVLPQDDAFSRRLVRQLIVDLSIWLPVRLYREIPILLPHCVRDANRTRNTWGMANAEGYLRDSSAILKNLVSGYRIRSPKIPVYHSARRGSGFVASHIWREIRMDGVDLLASRHPRTYSFVPNVAWLPLQISKLTDHEGSYAQQVLQAISAGLYAEHRHVHPPLIAQIWDSLPEPDAGVEIDLDELNYFQVSARAIKSRKDYLLRDISAIEDTLSRGVVPEDSPRSPRYLPSLLEAPNVESGGLLQWLAFYREFLTGSE